MPPKTMTAPRDLLVLTEKQWQRLVTDAADLFGWMWEHFPQMVGNPRGHPDLDLLRDGVTIHAELKTENGKVSDDQEAWHARCRNWPPPRGDIAAGSSYCPHSAQRRQLALPHSSGARVLVCSRR